MCGLAGLIRLGQGAASEQDAAMVRRMCELQHHRGPDDGGVVALGPVILGSRRLSIIDLSAAGHMPMSDATGRWWIAYNGEVYNFAAIRTELESLGHAFRSHTDTEVVLHAFMQWGSEAMSRFIGMFAFAAHDTQSGDVTLVRDRYGKKPLYYGRFGDELVFASEVKSLLSGRSGLRLNHQAITEWFLYRNIDGLRSRTLVDGVQMVLPGQMVSIRDGVIRTEQYYSPEREVSEADYRRYQRSRPEEVVEEIEQTLVEAVRIRLVSDVPVGTLLSGGLDSSLVTAIAARHTKALTTFHVTVEGYPNLDERRFAEELARSLSLPFVPFALNARNYLHALPQVAWLEDMPLTHANSVPYFLISQVAREHGVIVVQSGEGADELFGGYDWNYRRRRVLMRLESLLQLLPQKLHSLLALAVYATAGMPALAHRFREQLPPTVAAIDRYARVNWLRQCQQAYSFVPDRIERALMGAMLADLGDFLAPLLRRLDRNSMGASIECRAPFLDHRLVHKALNLPLEYRVGKVDKWVVKEVATRYIPASLVKRKKAGFPLPVQDYVAPLGNPKLFAGGFCEQVLEFGPQGIEQALSHTKQWGHGIFGLIAMEMWGRLHFMNQSTAQLGELVDACQR